MRTERGGFRQVLRARRARWVLACAVASGASAALEGCTTRDVVAVEVGVVTAHPSTASLLDGDELQFTATVADAEGRPLPTATVTWETEHEEVVSIDGTGLLVALQEGTATVRASFGGVSGTSVVRVLPEAVIELSEESVAFHAAVGEPSPPPVVIDVSVTGFGEIGGLEASVAFAPEQVDGWLSPTLAQTAAPTTLTLTPASSALPAGRYDANVVLDSDDDDGPVEIPVSLLVTGLTVAATDGSSSVTEAGGMDSLTVVLATEPDTDVVVGVTTADAGEVTADPTELTFTPSTWDAPQIVVLTGQDDPVADGDQTREVTVAVVDTLSDPAYAPVPDQAVPVTTLDDDEAGFVVAETGSGTLVVEGGTDELSVVLGTQPTSDVLITVASADPAQVGVAPATLTFDAESWATARTVVVTGVEDGVPDGTAVVEVTLAIDEAQSDDAFGGLADRVVSVTVIDGLTIVESAGSTTVTEAGETDSFTVVLGAEPASDVVVEVASDDPSEVTAAPERLTFTPSTWSTPRTVVVAGVDDAVPDGDVVTPVTLSVVEAESDPAFAELRDGTVLVTTLDDDRTGDFVVTETDGRTFVAEGGTDQLTVELDALPSSDVVITVTSSDPGQVAVTPTVLTFTPESWASSQQVTVTGVQDNVPDGLRTVDLTLSVDDDASDDAFDGAQDRVVQAVVVDGITVVETGGSTEVTEAGGSDGITVVLDVEPASDVHLDVTNPDRTEVDVEPEKLKFTPSNWNVPQPVVLRGEDDETVDGDVVTQITVDVREDSSDPAFHGVRSAPVSVTTVDDDVAGFTVDESGDRTVVREGRRDDFDVVLDAQPLSSVVIRITSADPNYVVVQPTSLIFTPENWDDEQEVDVFGVDNDDFDGFRWIEVTISIDDELSDDAFDALPDFVVNVLFFD